MEPIKFLATIPDIQSAIKTGSDGGRVLLEVPESDIAEFFKLAAFGRKKELRVTVEVSEW